MLTRLQRIKALREALVLAVVLVSLVSAALWIAREPADEDQLRLSVSTLRSQAAELDLLLSQAKNKWPPVLCKATPRSWRSRSMRRAKSSMA